MYRSLYPWSLACLMSTSLYGAQSKSTSHPVALGPVQLERIVGQIARLKDADPVERCSLRIEQGPLSGRSKEMDDLIIAASKEPMTTSMHFVAQVPSIEIMAYRLGSPPLVLYRDHSTLEQRQGPASIKLRELIEGHCLPKPAAAPR